MVRRERAVEARRLDHDEQVVLVLVGDAEEACGKVLGRAEHAVLALRAENGLRAVHAIQKEAVLDAGRDTEVVQLAASERRKELSAKLVVPVVEELELARGLELGRLQTSSKSGGTIGVRRRVTSAMALEPVHLL